MKKTDWKYVVDVLMFISMLGIIVVGLLMAFAMASGPMVNESEKYFLGLHRHQWGTLHLYLSLFFIAMLILHLALEWSWVKGKSQKIFKTKWKQALLIMTGLSVLVLILFWIFTPKYPVEYKDFGRGQGRAKLLPRTESAVASTLQKPAESSTERDPIEKPSTPPASRPEKSASRGQALRPSSRSQEPPLDKHRTETAEQEPKVVSGWQEADTSEIVITGRMTLRDVEKATGVRADQILAGMGLPRNLSKDEALGRLRRRYGFTLPQMREVIAGLMEKK
jgi:hypothetical protein